MGLLHMTALIVFFLCTFYTGTINIIYVFQNIRHDLQFAVRHDLKQQCHLILIDLPALFLQASADQLIQ